MHKLHSKDSAHDLGACVAIAAALTDSSQSQNLLLFMVCVP